MYNLLVIFGTNEENERKRFIALTMNGFWQQLPNHVPKRRFLDDCHGWELWYDDFNTLK